MTTMTTAAAAQLIAKTYTVHDVACDEWGYYPTAVEAAEAIERLRAQHNTTLHIYRGSQRILRWVPGVGFMMPRQGKDLDLDAALADIRRRRPPVGERADWTDL